MVDQFLAKVTDADRTTALAGWHDLRRQSDKLRTISHKQLQLLIGAAGRTSDQDVFRSAVVSLMQVIDARREAAGASAAAAPAVIDWLWQPFRQSSALMTTSQSVPQQDEAPEFYVGRLLHRERCPKLRLIHFPLSGDPSWQQVVSDRRCKAICILGRLGLFGDDAVEKLGSRNPRFRILPFGSIRRAATKNESPLDPQPQVFKIIEAAGAGELKEYVSDELHAQRADYAVVERYRILLGGRSIAVVRCAGCSPLGTLAAARWACEDLSDATSYRSPNPIPLPKGTTDTSQLHALIRVAAGPLSNHWEPKRIDVRKLFIDNWSWDAEEESWNLVPVQEIVLVQRPGQPARILFDGCAVNTRAESDASQLLTALVEAKLQTGSSVLDRNQLARKLQCSEKELGKQLSLLKCRRLHDALQVEDATVTLQPTTRVVDERNLEKRRTTPK